MCTPCDAGKFSNYQKSTSSTQCLSCFPGEFSVSGSALCKQCPVGKYAENFRTVHCSECDPGHFSDQPGAQHDHDCKDCDAGTFQPEVGGCLCTCTSGMPADINTRVWFQGGHGSCYGCGSGRYQDQTGQEDCVDCGPGTFNIDLSSEHQHACEPCPTGKWSAMAAADTCTACSSGKYGPDTHATCADVSIC